MRSETAIASYHPPANAWRAADWVFRFGYAAKGVVYGIVGILAVRYAWFGSGDAPSTRDALQSLAGETWGFVLLLAVGLGLVGYVLWRFMEAFADVEHKGTGGKGLAVRAGYAISGLIYGALALAAFSIAFWGQSRSGSEDGQQQQEAVSGVLGLPFGQWLVGLAGLILAGVGVHHVVRAVKKSFMGDYNTQEMSAREISAVRRIGQFGILSRAVTFLLIAWFLVQAGIQRDATEAKNLGESLRVLMAQPYGPWIVGIVGAGFIAYGVYCLSRARYREMVTH